MFINILKHLKLILQYSNFYRKDEEKEKDKKDKKENKVKVVHILYLTYVLHLTLKILLSNN